MNPITERNRQNAQKSSGPRATTGKARSSQNSLKTGLYSATALPPIEDPEEYRQDPFQADLVKILSDNVSCLRRIRGLVARQTAQVSFVLAGTPSKPACSNPSAVTSTASRTPSLKH